MKKTLKKISFNEKNKIIHFEISREEEFYNFQYDFIVD